MALEDIVLGAKHFELAKSGIRGQRYVICAHLKHGAGVKYAQVTVTLPLILKLGHFNLNHCPRGQNTR